MSPHSDYPVSAPSTSFTEPVPSAGSLTDSSSGTALHGSDKDRRVENITEIKEQGEGWDQDESGHGLTINMLPDDVLLEIFDSCRKGHTVNGFHNIPVWRWYGLVHVCQRWRQIVFGSSQRLDLQILCTYGTPVRESLDCWPSFPIAIQYFNCNNFTPDDEDSLFAALEHPGRIRRIDLSLMVPLFVKVTTVMQEPFPILTHLSLLWGDERPPALPSGFLGGSAPCLQYMRLEAIVFPALPTLLPSASDLGTLYLSNICEDSFIAPEVLVACLAALPRLKLLSLEFQTDVSRPDRILPPPITRTLFPALTYFKFQGDNKYLEELVSRIDCPQLRRISIKYLCPCPQVNFQVAPLFKFIDRSDDPEITLIRHANILFAKQWFSLKMYPCLEDHPDRGCVSALICCDGIERQVSRVAQVFSQPSAMLSRVLHLKLFRFIHDAYRHDVQWLHLLRQFSTVRTLHVSREFSRHIALVLEDVSGETVADVLPVLDLIHLVDLPATSVEKFLAVRRFIGHPVTFVDTEAEFDKRVHSYVSK